MNSRGAQCRDEAQGYTIVCGVPLHQHPMSSSWIPKIFKVEFKNKIPKFQFNLKCLSPNSK